MLEELVKGITVGHGLLVHASQLQQRTCWCLPKVVHEQNIIHHGCCQMLEAACQHQKQVIHISRGELKSIGQQIVWENFAQWLPSN
jgi:hypothetical protein